MRHVITSVAIMIGLVAALPSQASENEVGVEQNVHHQFLSKRPYQQPVVAKAESDKAWEGATLRVEQQEKHLQTLKMHQIGRRPL